MRWLTISEIKRRSKTAKGALKVSYEHWNQLYTATAKELRAENKRTERDLIFCSYCGLCAYYGRHYGSSRKCDYCILGKVNRCDCNYGLWLIAKYTMSDWINGREDGNWHAWKRACKALRDKLKELIEGSKRQ